MGYSGAGGKLIDEKNQKQKISWHYPFKICLRDQNETCSMLTDIFNIGQNFHFTFKFFD